MKNINQFKLTKREIEVLELVTKGYSNIEISKELKISISTSKVHVKNIMEKLNLKNRIQIIIFMHKDKLI